MAVVPMGRIEPDPQNGITGPRLAPLDRYLFRIDTALAAPEPQALKGIVGQPRADLPDIRLTDHAAARATEGDVDFGIDDEVTGRDVVIFPIGFRAGAHDETQVGTPRPTAS